MVSIIIPIYKAEKWIRRCIESCISQTYKDIEIILIDDGSPDSCPVICDEYEQLDDRIMVIHKTNGGVSSARNIGINRSNGDYICFVDSDDWLQDNAIEVMIEEQKISEYDLVVCNYILHNQNGAVNSREFENVEFHSGDQFLKYLLKTVSFLRTPWGKLYKAEIIKRNQIRFDEEMTLGEDTLFNYNYSKFVETLRILSEDYLYNYQEITSDEKTKRYFKSVDFISESRQKMFDGYSDIFNYKDVYSVYTVELSDNLIHSLSILENLLIVSGGTA